MASVVCTNDGTKIGWNEPFRPESDDQASTDGTGTAESDRDKDKSSNEFNECKHNSNRTRKKGHSYTAQDVEEISQNFNSTPEGENIKCSSAHDGRELMNETFPIHIDELFTLLFTNSKFYLDFHAARKTTDLTQTPWIHNPSENGKRRVVNLTMALKLLMGPKSAQVTETQIMHPCSKAGYLYSIDVETVNGGVPYSDSFTVEAHYCLQKYSESQSCLKVYGQVRYKKPVFGFIKSVIEKNTLSGLEDYFSALRKALENQTVYNMPRKSRRKHRIHSMLTSEADKAGIITEEKSRSGHPVGLTMIMLLVLLVVNIILYYKLKSLENMTLISYLDTDLIQNSPKSHEEWMQILQSQEALHHSQLQKWQKVVKSSINFLKQFEQSLSELYQLVHPIQIENEKSK